MTDIERAKQQLPGHSICLCRGEEIITDDSRGIAPMMRFIAEGRELGGFSCADLIVGRAAAMLFVKAGVAAVHGLTMSVGGRDYLLEHGIPCTFDVLTDRIINRAGTDSCPMEKTVAELTDPEEGYLALRRRIEEMKKNPATN